MTPRFCVGKRSRKHYGLARFPSEGLRQRRERGRRSAAILLQLLGHRLAPAHGSLVAEGAVTTAASLGSNLVFQAIVPEPPAAAVLEHESGRCGRASTRFVAVTRSLGRTTRNRTELSAPAPATERNDGSSGTVPRPASDAQACRVPSSGRDVESMGEVGEAGISFGDGALTAATTEVSLLPCSRNLRSKRRSSKSA
jgi:hypothetical protein